MRRIFVHVHVPKTAGTTFEKIIGRNFPKPEFTADGWLLPASDDRYRAEQMEKMLLLHPRMRAYSSHRVSLDLPYKRADWQIISMAWIRDPIERFVSSYFFERFANLDFCPAARELDLGRYIDAAMTRQLRSPVETVLTDYRSSQLAFLTGNTGTTTALDKVSSLINQGHLLLLPTERFADVCILLETMFPNDFRDCSFSERHNAAPRDQLVTAEHRDKIRLLVADDFPLKELAAGSFDATLRQCFSAEDALGRARRKFVNRCRIRQIQMTSIEWMEAVVKKRRMKWRSVSKISVALGVSGLQFLSSS